MKVREVIRLLEDNGWQLERMRGSHRQFKHPTNPNVVTVPDKEPTTIKEPTTVPVGTPQTILRLSGLKEDR